MALVTRHRNVGSAPGESIRVRGLVQGVGFRPAVWRLANECGLSGDVSNDADGVIIHIWGAPAARGRFVRRLHREAPPLAQIDALERAPLEGPPPDARFHIVASRSGNVRTGVVPDAAACPQCLREVLDVRDRRYGYPFTNCTNCGPRLSIVSRIPYDRGNTSMSAFVMCPTCRHEYEDPRDRRFHAQPNACPDCGPRLSLEPLRGTRIELGADPIESTRRLLQAGHIVAIKGIGGIHLACDATNRDAVGQLRSRKHRFDKPFAVMGRDEPMIRRYCRLSEGEAALLHSPAAPIVLLDSDGPERLAHGVAPGQRCYGFMLPYTPLHCLLMFGLDVPIVLTSGNRAEEPQCIDNQEARDRLGDIADHLLLHDRQIVNRLDDSVIRVIAGAPTLLRRARGYAPAPLRLPIGFGAAPQVLAFGGELKNTFCLLKDGAAILSQHLGDLEHASANATYRQTLRQYLELFEHRPKVVAIDGHPDYLTSKLGREWAESSGAALVAVQHHHAHIAACLADNAVDEGAGPVLGLALDGIGYGDDGTFWGGEFLLADYRTYRRLASLEPVPMPGGVQAIREPWRMAYAHLRRVTAVSDLMAEHEDQPFFSFLADQPLRTLDGMIARGVNTPHTSSCGRLFDAVAAVCGLRQRVTYEGQAAMELEAAVDRTAMREVDAYPFEVSFAAGLARIDPRPMWLALLSDLRDRAATGVIAARFHAGLAQSIANMIDLLAQRYRDPWCGRIALSGGVFQNREFSEALIGHLESRGLAVLRHAVVPPNDGGLSLGQAAVAAARTMA